MTKNQDSTTTDTRNQKHQDSGKKTTDNNTNTSDKIIGNLLSPLFSEKESFVSGLENLKSLPIFSPDVPPVNGKEFSMGVMGFRRIGGGNLSLAIACGKAQVRYISLAKFIALIENMHDPESATIMLQNFQDQDEYRSAKGQVLGRINATSSAITVIQGVAGKIIRGPSDIALFDVYYQDRATLTAFYIAAKTQISTADTLETMITTYDGWKAFSVPLDPLDPYGD